MKAELAQTVSPCNDGEHTDVLDSPRYFGHASTVFYMNQHQLAGGSPAMQVDFPENSLAFSVQVCQE
jgi:hypothetical protein